MLTLLQKTLLCLELLDTDEGVSESAWHMLLHLDLVPERMIEYIDSTDGRFYLCRHMRQSYGQWLVGFTPEEVVEADMQFQPSD